MTACGAHDTPKCHDANCSRAIMSSDHHERRETSNRYKAIGMHVAEVARQVGPGNGKVRPSPDLRTCPPTGSIAIHSQLSGSFTVWLLDPSANRTSKVARKFRMGRAISIIF